MFAEIQLTPEQAGSRLTSIKSVRLDLNQYTEREREWGEPV